MKQGGEWMKIGDFARLGNVSTRTLRFYSQAGLLQPALVSPVNGYRHYHPRQLAQLRQIHVFKDMGLSLPEIGELLKRRLTPGELRKLFWERRGALLEKMQEDAGRLAGRQRVFAQDRKRTFRQVRGRRLVHQ